MLAATICAGARSPCTSVGTSRTRTIGHRRRSTFCTSRSAAPVGDVTTPIHSGIAGSGRFGQIVNRLLVASGVKTVVLDHEVAMIDMLGKFGVKSYYGDASRPDLLHAAGIESAKAIVIAIDDNVVVVREAYVDFHGDKTTKEIEMHVRQSQGG